MSSYCQKKLEASLVSCTAWWVRSHSAPPGKSQSETLKGPKNGDRACGWDNIKSMQLVPFDYKRNSLVLEGRCSLQALEYHGDSVIFADMWRVLTLIKGPAVWLRLMQISSSCRREHMPCGDYRNCLVPESLWKAKRTVSLLRQLLSSWSVWTYDLCWYRLLRNPEIHERIIVYQVWKPPLLDTLISFKQQETPDPSLLTACELVKIVYFRCLPFSSTFNSDFYSCWFFERSLSGLVQLLVDIWIISEPVSLMKEESELCCSPSPQE